MAPVTEPPSIGPTISFDRHRRIARVENSIELLRDDVTGEEYTPVKVEALWDRDSTGSLFFCAKAFGATSSLARTEWGFMTDCPGWVRSWMQSIRPSGIEIPGFETGQEST